MATIENIDPQCQASEFWDSHDFTEFPDIQEVKGVRFKYSLINDWLKEKVGV